MRQSTNALRMQTPSRFKIICPDTLGHTNRRELRKGNHSQILSFKNHELGQSLRLRNDSFILHIPISRPCSNVTFLAFFDTSPTPPRQN